MSIAGTTLEHQFYVCDGLTHDCLLGNDFLRLHRGVVDFDAKKFSFDEDIEIRAVLAEKTTIPPNTEMNLMCPISQAGKKSSMLFEPDENLPCNIFASATISNVDEKHNRVCVRVINNGDSAMVFRRGFSVGTVRPISAKNIFTVLERRVSSVHATTEQPRQQIKFPSFDDSRLTPEQRRKTQEMLSSFADVFSQGAHDIGQTDIVQHKIETGTNSPIKCMPRRVPMHRQATLQSMVDEMEANGIIRRSDSSWASPIVLAPKKDGTLRFCVDYRALNEVTRKDAYPIPRIDDILEHLQGAKYFCHLDLASGYWQVKVDEESVPKTAFCIPGGLYEFTVMPFGLCNAPPTFQRLMNTILKPHLGKRAKVYLDDIVIWAKTMDEMIENLRLVLQSLREANLKLKPSKCKLFRESVDMLGHVISANGISTDPAKTKIVQNWPEPRNIGELRTFIGMTSYYRKFIRTTLKKPSR